MKRRTKRKTVAQRIRAGMRELEHAMDSGRPLRELFTIRTVQIADPNVHDAGSVRKTRSRLHVSQAVFAKLLGVSVELVEHWEQGICAPRGAARRLLDEIARDPSGYLARHISQPQRDIRKVG